MTFKRKALGALTRAELLEVGKALELDVNAGMNLQGPAVALPKCGIVLGLGALVVSFLALGCEQCESGARRATIEATSLLGSTSTAGGTVVAFLRERREGHSGEQYWREVVGPYAKMDGWLPTNPTEWKVVLDKDGHTPAPWAWLRYRVKSTTAAGLPIEKLWDFCLNETVKGFRIVGAWEADDATVSRCEKSPQWPMYQYDTPRPKQ